MIDHLSLPTVQYDQATAFYDAALAELGAERCVNMVAHWDPEWPERRLCAYGVGGKPTLWIHEVKTECTPRHIAFSAEGTESVAGFYKSGLAAGGKSNGEPGPRELYHPGYYGGFLLDPDGNNVEAVFHAYQATK